MAKTKHIEPLRIPVVASLKSDCIYCYFLAHPRWPWPADRPSDCCATHANWLEERLDEARAQRKLDLEQMRTH